MSKLTVVVAAIMVAGGAVCAKAQSNPQTRDGFTIAFGLGAGSASISCSGCTSDRQNGLSGFLRIGGAVRPDLIIAGETRGWTHSEGTETDTFGYLLGAAQFYPQPKTGWYLEGGLGLGSTSLKDGTDELSSTGMAMLVGTGYDIRLGKNFSLTPYLNYLTTFGANAQFNGSSLGSNLNGNVVQLGLGFTWH